MFKKQKVKKLKKINIIFLLFFFIVSGNCFSKNKIEGGKNLLENKNIYVSIDKLIVEEDKLPLNLINLISLGIARNNQTKISWINIQKTKNQITEARSNYYPKIYATTSYIKTFTQETLYNQNYLKAGASAGYNSLNIPKEIYETKSLKNYLSIVKVEKDIYIRNLIFDLIEYYYKILQLKAQIKAAKEIEKASFESYQAASVRYEIGLAPLVDKLKSKSSYSQNKLDRISIEKSLKTSEGELNVLLNLAPSYPLYLAEQKIKFKFDGDKPFEVYVETAHKKREEIQKYQEQIKQLKNEIFAIGSSRAPTLSASVNYDYTFKFNNKNSINSVNGSDITLGAGLSIPLFPGFDVTSRISIKKKEIAILILEIEDNKKKIEFEVWESFQSLETSKQKVKTSNDLLKTAQESFDISTGMYKNGKASILDLLDAQTQLSNAKKENISAKYELILSKFALLGASGEITVDSINELIK